jgi:hypothetical protein
MSQTLLRIGLVVGAGLLIAVVAAVVLTGSGGSSPSSLAVGDCIDVPTSAAISSIPKRSCTTAHAGEVFHVFDAADASAYPSDPEWGRLVYPVCDPAFEAYTGTPVETQTDIDYQFFVPTPDRWAAGERSVTCYITSLDGSPLVRSYRRAG